jgi:hypothetical protein
MRISCLAAISFWLAGTALRADVINSPPHSHAHSPVVTWDDGHTPIESHFHQHRTNHPVDGTGAADHGAVAHYEAFGTWQNDGTFHWFLTGGTSSNARSFVHEEWGHGHMDNAVPYRVVPAVAGGGITAAAAAAWNAGAAARVGDAFAAWMDVGNASGPANWPNDDNDHVAGTGVAWHSSVNFRAVDRGETIRVILGDPSTGSFCDGDSIGCWDPGTLTVIFSQTTDWYYGTSTDPTVAPMQFDFLSTAVHEVGHVVGLLHFGTFASGAIMTAESQTDREGDRGILRDIDASATHGVRDMYAIAVPEPTTFAMLSIGILWVLYRQQRARKQGLRRWLPSCQQA